MPKTFLQGLYFTIIMAFLMVYTMICYNISLSTGGMSNQVFLMAFSEIKIMWPIAIILEMTVVEKLSGMLAERVITANMAPITIIVIRSALIVCLMCPTMSFIATLLFKNAGSEIIADWLQTAVFNFPMALCAQIFFCGPLGRLIFRNSMKLVPEK